MLGVAAGESAALYPNAAGGGSSSSGPSPAVIGTKRKAEASEVGSVTLLH